jgi:hypothetical protein
MIVSAGLSGNTSSVDAIRLTDNQVPRPQSPQ